MNLSSCVICKSNNSAHRRLWDKRYSKSILVCQNCGVGETSGDDSFDGAQVENYRFSKLGELIFLVNRFTRVFYLLRLNLQRSSRLADWGCGRGDFLLLLRRYSKNVFGIEYDENTSREAKARGLHVYTFSSDHELLMEDKTKSVDFLFAFHFLEHVKDPSSFLIQFDRLLAQNGKLIIEVPNLDSIQRKLSGKHWYGFDTRNHYFHFDPNSLRELLERNGFTIKYLGTFSLEYGATMFYFSMIKIFTAGKFDLFELLNPGNLNKPSKFSVYCQFLLVLLSLPLALIVTLSEFFFSLFNRGGVVRVVAVRSNGQ